ncbi:Ger(x)C family spore germination protein [Niallia oryzisoli]|uniref:Ger(X)C family spore germination protein n=1 Tax=Niallia oryzisoli TaxID=1737571 RepID=A0ABZ2CAN2_9BACI
MGCRWGLLFIMFVSVSVLSGCWSQKELTDLALVSAMGIDKNEKGKYVTTFQIVNPGNVAAGKQGSNQASPVTVFTITGNNVVETSREATKQIPRRLYYAHTNLVVISEKLAKEEGILKIFDAMDRDPEFRTTTTVIIARNTTAAEVVNKLTAIEKVPANKVIKTLDSSEKRWGEFFNVMIQDVIRDLVSAGREPMISGFYIKGNSKDGKKMNNLQQTTPDGQLVVNGMAVFKKGKLISWLQGEPARGASFILNKVQSSDININWEGEKEAIAYELIRQNTKVSARLKKDGVPAVTIHTRAEGDIGELMVPIDITDPMALLKIEKVVEKEIEKEIKMAVERAQKDQSDILGFGEKVHLANPKAWKRMKQDWNEIHFPKTEVTVKVDAFVRRTGIRNKSYLSNMEK